MAQFDSDSESDNETTSKAQRPIARPNFTNNTSTNEPAQRKGADNADSDGDEEDDDITMPRGRMAARLQAEGQNGEVNKSDTAYDRIKKTLKEQEKGSQDDEEEDDLPMAGPRRRQANKQNNSEDEESDRSPSPARSFSPLFMSSPATQRHAPREDNGSDGSDEEEPQLKNNARLQALIAQKRKEREERERIEAEKKAARAKQNEQFGSDVLSGGDSGDDNDRGSAKKLSQQARPSRKASKKALEEMNRETQRMSRNMQLAHQAQTKKKITKESFFARFNFGQPKTDNAGPLAENSSTTASQNSSDGEAQKDRETPRTSPVMGPADKPVSPQTMGDKRKETETEAMEFTMPPLEEVLAGTHLQHEEPIVARAEVQTEEPQQKAPESKPQRKTLTKPPVRVQLSRQSVAEHQREDSDSDLEVVTSPAKCRRVAAFENIKTKRSEESASMLKLKALAHLTFPDRQATSTNFAQLSADLLAQARKQAADERKQRIDELRAQGVFIETAEERQAMEDEIENLVEKARQEADDIAKQERKEKKQGQGDDDDDSDEGDYEPSGSEDEDQGDDDEVDEEEEEDEEETGETGAQNDENMIDAEAGENEESADERSEAMSADEADVPSTRRKRPTRVIEDEDDEDEQQHEPRAPATPINPITPNKGSAARPEFPGLEDSGGLTMGLTQAFAGTLAGSGQDTQPNTPSVIPSLPDPAYMVNGVEQSDSEILVRDSQEQQEQTAADIFAGYAPSEGGVSESPAPRAMSEFSQVPEPTQDAGFVYSPFEPSKRFRPPPSTVETVVVERHETPDSLVVSKKNKHLRRGRADDNQGTEEQSKGDFEIDSSAFDVMRKATKKKNIVPFDKQKSKAKDVVEDAAEESEDEYAGLGGASDDSDGEEDAYDQSMINDNSGEVVDEKLLARLNAARQRDDDAKQVEKLMRDITTGALRRRRGADDDLDLDDPEDELLARRREKQREFARMRRALLADEKVNEIAENPKKAAFFKAIEDRDEEDDVDLEFLEYENEGGSQEQSSQDVASEGQKDPAGPETENNDNKRKRPLEPSAEDIANRPPPHLRRKPASHMSKKPATLAEIRETVSFLTETHEYDSFHEDAAIDEESDHDEQMAEAETPTAEEPKEDFVPRTHNHNHPRRTRGPVVDRLALLRQASSNSAQSSASTRFAFHAGAGNDAAANIGFRPPLLRKNTANSSSSGSVSSGYSDSRKTMKAPAGASTAKKGAVNYYTAAREKERERAIRAKERSSGSNVAALLNKHASNRRGLGALGKGQWE